MGNWSAEFNGAGSGGDSLMEIADISQVGLNPTGNFSVWFWLELLAITGHNGRRIVLKDHSTNFQYTIEFGAADGSTLIIEVYETSGGNQHRRSFSGLAISADSPTHIGITFNAGAAGAGTQFELFKNGTSQGNGTLVSGVLISGTFDSDGPFKIGGGTGQTENADQVRLFDLRFYDAIVAPTTTTHKQILATPGTETNLQLNVFRGTSDERWTSNSALVQDASTNGNDLSITNQAVADCPVEADEWPGPSRGDVEYPSETVNNIDVVDNGPSASGVTLSEVPYRGYDAFYHAPAQLYYEVPYRGYDADVAPILGGEGGGGPGLTYRMRGYDTTLTQIVFWASTEVDSDASDYGGPGPVNDIVVHKILGS